MIEEVERRGGKHYQTIDGHEKAIVPVTDPLTGEEKQVMITSNKQHVEQTPDPVLPEDPRPSPLNPFTILGVLFSSLGALGMVMRW